MLPSGVVSHGLGLLSDTLKRARTRARELSFRRSYVSFFCLRVIVFLPCAWQSRTSWRTKKIPSAFPCAPSEPCLYHEVYDTCGGLFEGPEQSLLTVFFCFFKKESKHCYCTSTILRQPASGESVQCENAFPTHFVGATDKILYKYLFLFLFSRRKPCWQTRHF